MAESNIYHTAIENALEAFFLTKTDGTIVEVNAAACHMFGYTDDEFKYNRQIQVIDPESPQLAFFEEERNRKGKIVCELTGIRKSGERFPISVSSILLQQNADKGLTLTIIQDISEQKRQQDELRNSEINLRMILDNTEEMFLIVDPELKVVNFNKATEKKSLQVLGTPFQIGKSVLESTSPERVPALKKIYEAVFAGESKYVTYDLKSVAGGVITIEIHYSPIFVEKRVVAAMVNVRDITEQAKIRKERENIRLQLQRAEEIAAIGSCQWDFETNHLNWSDEFFRICGFEPRSFEPDQERTFKIIHPDDQAKVRAAIEHTIKSGEDYDFEARILRPDGLVRNIFSHGKILYNSQGEKEKLIGIFHDITDKKTMARELIESELLFKAMVEHSADIVLLINAAREITYISPAAGRLMGFTATEVLGKRLKDLLFEEDLPRMLGEFEEILANPGKPFSKEYRVKTKTGGFLWMEGTVTNLLHLQGVNSVIINQRDITAEKIREKELLTANERFHYAVKATKDAIWDWDLESDIITRTGDGLRTNFGYDVYEASKDPNFWIQRVHPEDKDSMLQKRTSVLENPAALYWEDEYRFLKSDGNYAFVFDKGYILRDGAGKAQRMIGATQNISHQKETEALLLELNNRLKKRAEDLVNSNIELERFAYVASHDLQEPLRMVTSFLQLLKKKYRDQLDEVADQYIHFAVDGAERMKQLIMDLLEYSRVGFNRENNEPVDLNKLLKEQELLFEKTCQETGAVINTGPMPVVQGNKMQLSQLFQNLIGNAIKYHHKDRSPVVTIGSEEQADQFLFFVKDNGIGIEPAFFEKVFVIFQRLHNKSDYGGTGIGLAICKKIVEKHGGTIWVESTPQQGSCFYFTISKTSN
ncbi:MAG: PAS domain S-box protein [Chitinophagaceae bacterium]|nr:PAS domain S-box protein [Chitinophagaceae bacterium]